LADLLHFDWYGDVLGAAALLPAWSDVESEQGGETELKGGKQTQNENQGTEHGRFPHVAADLCIVFHLVRNVGCCVLGNAHLPLSLRRV
jgi:hypothetical protein